MPHLPTHLPTYRELTQSRSLENPVASSIRGIVARCGFDAGSFTVEQIIIARSIEEELLVELDRR